MPQTIFIIVGFLLAVIGILVWIANAAKLRRLRENGGSRYDLEGPNVGRFIGAGLAIGGLLLGGILLLVNSIVINGVGEAKVITEVDGSVVATIEQPTTTTKAPWQGVVDFDLFSQEVLYAGGDVAPSYSGGVINGKEVTVSVGGTNGGSTQANIDISVTYSLDPEGIQELYEQYRTQERFTKQVIEKTILSTIRAVPAQYTAVEFRGEQRAAAQDLILERLNDKLNPLGITVDFVNLQDIRYPENVEQALRDVEAANQAALKAEADLRAAEVAAQQRIVEAQAQADANNILNASLTANLLQQRYIEALAKANTIYVVPDGSTPFVGAVPR